jgi:hypothetical protein
MLYGIEYVRLEIGAKDTRDLGYHGRCETRHLHRKLVAVCIRSDHVITNLTKRNIQVRGVRECCENAAWQLQKAHNKSDAES